MRIAALTLFLMPLLMADPVMQEAPSTVRTRRPVCDYDGLLYAPGDIDPSRNFFGGTNGRRLDHSVEMGRPLMPMQRDYSKFAASLANRFAQQRAQGVGSSQIVRDYYLQRTKFIEQHDNPAAGRAESSFERRKYSRVTVKQYEEFHNLNHARYAKGPIFYKMQNAVEPIVAAKFSDGAVDLPEAAVSEKIHSDALARLDAATDTNSTFSKSQKLDEIISGVRGFCLAQRTDHGTGTYADALLRGAMLSAFNQRIPMIDGVDLMAISFSEATFREEMKRRLDFVLEQ